ncbi:helix-turn-helix domain-containing protein [Micromonospora sp. KC723]|uniref:helix-turn-helix domain-containing protein n=1 Tax=Micromonospora sp. KC723 TaxID=2530381 RepID=UPI00104EE591|nr:helix-turn-helix domain-containing protein [Micromonospora sp. KC723]TDB76747.1 helix-turn-helix domain-containing protein [Micromonospora sp. KC723]
MNTPALSGFHRELVDLLLLLRAGAGNPSYRDLARRSNVAVSTVSNVLNGTKLPTPEVARALAAALDAKPDRQEKAGRYAELAKRDRPARRAGLRPFPYLEQVERIVPPKLLDRAEELRELAEFCQGAGVADYTWWQAPAWSGKTSLMAWFVLHPPAGVRILSFFVTARLAGQNTRAAFVEVVTEQLAVILNEPALRDLPEATREPHLLRMLDEAARRCKDRLVLLVDGLDEERRDDGHSIAALLPIRPKSGLRVVVAGRGHPPIPGDVPAHHPLRDPTIIRPLPAVTAATAVKEEAERDLMRILRGPDAGRRILGLVTAAGGGLTTEDLVDLTRLDPWVVDDHLTSGRVYQRSYRGAYQLAHEELVTQATRFLGVRNLDEHRGCLFEWASRYRDAGWPADTPEYLLHEYVPMLDAIRDLDTMVALTTDSTRYDRMLKATGGDATALRDVASALRLAVERSDPGAACLLRLHQQRLIGRNVHVPVGLPALWAAVGQLDRAVALADSLRDDVRRTARVEIGAALVRAGDLAGAEAWAATHDDDRRELLRRMAETAWTAEARSLVVRLVEALPAPSTVLQRVTRTAVEAGDLAGAEALLNLHPGDAVEALAPALAAAGRIDDAEAMARAVVSPRVRARALHGVARAVAGTGNVDRAAAIAELVPSSYGHRNALISVARRLAGIGYLEAAIAYGRRLDEALWPMLAIHIAGGRLVHAVTTAPERVADLAERVAAEHPRPAIVEETAELLAPGGRIVEDAAQLLSEDADSAWLNSNLMRLANEIARTGRYADAMRIARLVVNDKERAEAVDVVARIAPRAAAADAVSHTPETLVAVGRRLAAAGRDEDATELAVRVERAARQRHDAATDHRIISSPPRRDRRPSSGTGCPAALVGDPDGMVEHIRSLDGSHAQVDTILAAIEAMCEAGDADILERFARQVAGRSDELTSELATVEALASLDAFEPAEEFARRLSPRYALAAVAEAQAARGSLERAEALADEVGSAHLYGTIAASAATRDDVPRARRLLARAVAESDWQQWVPVIERLDPSAVRRVRTHAKRLSPGSLS